MAMTMAAMATMAVLMSHLGLGWMDCFGDENAVSLWFSSQHPIWSHLTTCLATSAMKRRREIS
jgi:hypothetical protein